MRQGGEKPMELELLIGWVAVLSSGCQGQSGVRVFSSFLVTTSLADLYFLASNFSVGLGIVRLF
jgi:hypothetical protein